MHNKINNVEKSTDFKGSLIKALSFNKKYIPFVASALLLSMLSSILTIIGPDKLKEITNVITAGLMTKIDIDKVSKIATILLVIYALSFIFNYVQRLQISFQKI